LTWQRAFLAAIRHYQSWQFSCHYCIFFKDALLEIVVFTLNAMVVYLLADRLLLFIETRRGSRIKQRQLAFLGIFLILILISFKTLEMLFKG
jgi:hypothetical protein